MKRAAPGKRRRPLFCDDTQTLLPLDTTSHHSPRPALPKSTSLSASPPVRAVPDICGPKAIPGAKPRLVYSADGEASLAAHQAAEPTRKVILRHQSRRDQSGGHGHWITFALDGDGLGGEIICELTGADCFFVSALAAGLAAGRESNFGAATMGGAATSAVPVPASLMTSVEMARDVASGRARRVTVGVIPLRTGTSTIAAGV
jgi:hypothetical protein